MNSLAYLKKHSPKLTKWLAKPLGRIGRFLLWILVLPIYKVYLIIKKLVNKFYAPQKSRHKFIHPFSRRYLTHLIIIVISILTVSANLNAYEAHREEFGQTSIISALVTNEDLGTLEEEGPISNNKKVTHYLGQTGVAAQLQVTAGQENEEIGHSTVAGDSAIVRPILSPVEEELRQRDEITYYTVQNGDTISEIAEKFGVTSNTILWENNLSAYSVIRPGDKLTILPTAGIRHKVVKGETLAQIAKKYKVEADQILEFNKIASADDILIGEQIMIPGGQKPYVAPTYTFRNLYQPAPSGPKVVATGKMFWPTNCHRITQYFRWGHSALDIACSSGQPIYAADSGQIIEAQSGWNGGYGNVIMIDHGSSIQTVYGHLSKFYVKVGESVEKGQMIGAMGSTGRSTGPHIHFEVRVSGARKNPLYYVK